MSLLFLDTETSGLPDFRAPSEEPSQPFIVQLAALLTDVQGNSIAGINLIIHPGERIIPNEVAEIHGITTEKAVKYGVDIKTAFETFRNLLDKAENLVAHNIGFDVKMIKIASVQAKAENFWTELERLKQHCTMRMSQPICKLPLTGKQAAAGFNGFKQPKLIEAYTHFYGKGFDKAHDALADVTACKDVYFKIKTQQEAA